MKLTRPSHERACTPPKRPLAALLAVVITTATALVAAGCGGSSNSPAAANLATTAASAGVTGSNSAAGSNSNALKFAQCLRSHGVPDFPDPSSSGQLTIPPDDMNTPAFQRASKACQSLMPGAGGAEQTSNLSRAQQLRLAKCIRAHGVPNFPDPNASGAFPSGSVNLNSPAVRSALQACQPKGITPPPGATSAP